MAQSPSTSTRLSEAFVISCGTITLDVLERKVLLIRWKNNGEIFLPKGRKNIGESLEDAAIRETYEETGFQVAIAPLRVPTLATPGTAVDEQVDGLNTEPIAFTSVSQTTTYSSLYSGSLQRETQLWHLSQEHRTKERTLTQSGWT